MFRITTMFLCALFLAAVAGRYSAEESVRAARGELIRIETEYKEEERQVQLLRAEIAYLESPDRLAKIAKSNTELRPANADNFQTASAFRAIMTGGEEIPSIAPPPNDAFIANAIAMAQLAGKE